MTRRLEMAELLKQRELPLKNLAHMYNATVSEIENDLKHIALSARPDYKLCITPASCKKCGFLFRHRERINPPSKCPRCRSERIEPPLFSLKPTQKQPKPESTPGSQ